MEEGALVYEGKIPKIDAADRFKICQKCPLYLSDIEVCNPDLWLNSKTGEVSKKAKSGFTRGCGCLIARKARQPGSHCHIGKW